VRVATAHEVRRAVSRRDRVLLSATGVAALLLVIGLALYLRPLDPDVLALQTAWSPRRFAEIVHAWPAEHLARFRAHLPVDGLLLLTYGAFGYLLATRTALFAGRGDFGRGMARCMLPLAAGFDAVENLLHAWLTEVPRIGPSWPYAASAFASACKWALLIGYGLLLARALLDAAPDANEPR
jgi:hypothetical protein